MPTFQTCPISQQARRNPHRLALLWPDGQLTYEELDQLVNVVAQRLVEAGVEGEDRVGLVLPNSWQYVVLLQSIFRSKAVAVPLSTRFTAEMVDDLLRMTGCKAVVGDADSESADWLKLYDFVDRERGIASSKNVAGIAASMEVDQPATILFSSGSTGRPKAILHTWGNHYFNALGSNENIVVAPNDRWLLSLPLFHVAGQAIMFRCFIAGATIVLPTPEKSLPENLRDDAITHVSLVSTQVLRLLDELSHKTLLPALKGILLGGSAISRDLITRAHASRLPIHTSYGMTEMGSQIATTAPGAGLDELFTSGSVLKYSALRIDVDGQILVRGKTRFAGLVTGAGAGDLLDVFDEEGWYATGDLGKLDEKGRLVVLGRKDNMFISGGENIHPEEIERALEQHDQVRRAIVVPVPDAEFGCRPVAFVDAAGDALPPATLTAHLEGRIARFMRPIAYFSLEEVQSVERGRAEEMKISRKALQEIAKEKTVK